MPLSVGLNTLMRALIAQQQALDTTSHNVSNVNTPGYSRQRVRLASLPPSDPTQPGLPGNGVAAVGIERLRDIFIDFQRRGENRSAGYYAARSDSLQIAETTLGEPSGNGLRQVMTDFFRAWQDVANEPQQSAMRSAVVQAGSTLAFTARRIDGSLRALRDDANRRIEATVEEINNLGDQIAVLNRQIIALRGVGDPAGDLTDRRDLAVDRLARLADVEYTEGATGQLTVAIGGRSLVTGSNVQRIAVVGNPVNNNYFDVVWASDGGTVAAKLGELGGLIEQRDLDLTGRLTDLNSLVGRVIADVNTVHRAGVGGDGIATGNDFFSGGDAGNISVNTAVEGNLTLVAAATAPNSPGDGRNALLLSGLHAAKTMTAGTKTFDEFYNAFVTALAVDAKSMSGLADAQQVTVAQLDQLQLAAAGVNLDEEMVSLIQFQRAYQAASRVIGVIDSLLDTLINKTI